MYHWSPLNSTKRMNELKLLLSYRELITQLSNEDGNTDVHLFLQSLYLKLIFQPDETQHI